MIDLIQKLPDETFGRLKKIIDQAPAAIPQTMMLPESFSSPARALSPSWICGGAPAVAPKPPRCAGAFHFLTPECDRK